jgi:hypothetical protein
VSRRRDKLVLTLGVIGNWASNVFKYADFVTNLNLILAGLKMQPLPPHPPPAHRISFFTFALSYITDIYHAMP